MKKIFLSVLSIGLITLFASNCFAASKFGPINPEKKDKVSVGVEYFNSQNEWEPKNGDWDTFKSSQNQVSVTGEYSITDKIQISGNLGAADMTIDDAFEGDSDIGIDDEDLEGDFTPFGSFGIKGLLYEKDNLSLGMFFQTSFYGKYSDERSVNINWNEYFYRETVDCSIDAKEEITIKNQWDANLGLSLQTKYKNSILYAGPFLYMNRAKVNYTISGNYSVSALGYTYRESFSESDSCKHEEKTNVGAFVGADIDLGKDFKINGECQIRSEPSFGVSISKTF